MVTGEGKFAGDAVLTGEGVFAEEGVLTGDGVLTGEGDWTGVGVLTRERGVLTDVSAGAGCVDGERGDWRQALEAD